MRNDRMDDKELLTRLLPVVLGGEQGVRQYSPVYCVGAFLERLEADTFYDGVHYLNPLSYRFAVRDRAARQAALEDIRDALEHSTDEELELMVSRRFMHSL